MQSAAPSPHQPLPPDLFLAQPRNADRLAGTTRRVRGHYESAVLLMLMLLSCCLFLNLQSLRSLREWFSMRDQGQTTLGVVINRHEQGAGHSKTFFLTYRYSAPYQGRLIEQINEEQVGQIFYEQHPPGSQLAVRYQTEAPGISSVSWSAEWPTEAVQWAVVFGLGLLALLAVLIWRVRAGLKLQDHGQIIIGAVVASTVQPVKGSRQIKLTYRFPAPDGATIEGRETIQRDDLPKEPLPAGTPVAVIYVSPRIFQLL